MEKTQGLDNLITRLKNQSKWTKLDGEYQCRLDDAKIRLQLKQGEFILRVLGTGDLTLARYTFDDSDPYTDTLRSIYEQARKCSQQYNFELDKDELAINLDLTTTVMLAMASWIAGQRGEDIQHVVDDFYGLVYRNRRTE